MAQVLLDQVSHSSVDDVFRNYEDSDRHATVENHYRNMRKYQTVEYVLRMKAKYSPLNHAKMTIWEAFEALDDFVDASDPDTDFPNMVHMLQTAESLKEAGEPDWMQLTGLIHDLGKLVHLFSEGRKDGQDGNGGDQWGIAGDTFVVGCALPDCLVFPQFNMLHPDMKNPKYNTTTGMYKPHCGLHNVHVAFGHDEYLYMVLKNHPKCSLPQEALDVIRFHSMYPFHQGGAYKELMNEQDHEMLQTLKRFQQHDLYTKHSNPPSLDDLKPYYEALVEKYIPGSLSW